jgi:Chaperone of endosialidase
VYVGSTGGLGRGVPSSRRFKTDIHPLRNLGARLMRLTPVSFRYRRGDHALRYGLIAAQVAKVLPALVINDSKGRPRALKMEQLPTLLLAQVEAQQRQIRDLERRIARLEHRRR